MSHSAGLSHTWLEPPPESLSLLERAHLKLFELEEFWTTLVLALDYSKGEIGQCCGVSYSYTTVPSMIMAPYIKGLLPSQIDWVTLRLDQETAVIIHYAAIQDDQVLSADIGAGLPKISIKTAMIAESTLIVAKLRLMGDQIIQENADRDQDQGC